VMRPVAQARSTISLVAWARPTCVYGGHVAALCIALRGAALALRMPPKFGNGFRLARLFVQKIIMGPFALCACFHLHRAPE